MKLTTTRRSLGINAAARSTEMIARTTRGLRQFDDGQRRTTGRAIAAFTPRRGMVGKSFCVEDSHHVGLSSEIHEDGENVVLRQTEIDGFTTSRRITPPTVVPPLRRRDKTAIHQTDRDQPY